MPRLALPLACALGACVPTTRYRALESSYDEAVAARDRAQSEAEACGASLAEEERAAARRAAEVEAVRLRLVAVQERGLATLVERDGGFALQLPTDELFLDGAADLSEPGASRLEEVAGMLVDPPLRLRVVGTTDATAPSKEFPTPWHLGSDRAIAVVLALVGAGLAPEHLSASASAPTAPGQRRIELVWAPEPWVGR